MRRRRRRQRKGTLLKVSYVRVVYSCNPLSFLWDPCLSLCQGPRDSVVVRNEMCTFYMFYKRLSLCGRTCVFACFALFLFMSALFKYLCLFIYDGMYVPQAIFFCTYSSATVHWLKMISFLFTVYIGVTGAYKLVII